MLHNNAMNLAYWQGKKEKRRKLRRTNRAPIVQRKPPLEDKCACVGREKKGHSSMQSLGGEARQRWVKDKKKKTQEFSLCLELTTETEGREMKKKNFVQPFEISLSPRLPLCAFSLLLFAHMQRGERAAIRREEKGKSSVMRIVRSMVHPDLSCAPINAT